MNRMFKAKSICPTCVPKEPGNLSHIPAGRYRTGMKVNKASKSQSESAGPPSRSSLIKGKELRREMQSHEYTCKSEFQMQVLQWKACAGGPTVGGVVNTSNRPQSCQGHWMGTAWVGTLSSLNVLGHEVCWEFQTKNCQGTGKAPPGVE